MAIDWRRFAPYLLITILVNVLVTLAVLWVWDRNRPVIVVEAPSEADATQVAAGGTVVVEPTAPPTAGPPTATVHVVAAGETLGQIAERYDVDLADLMAANNLDNPNVLAVGQTLTVPIGGLQPTPTAPPADQPTSTPIPTATPDPDAPPPEIAIARVIDAGQMASEAVVLLNQGGPLDLAGWRLRSESGAEYLFPSLTLFEGGSVNIHTADGQNSVVDLYWGQSDAVWARGASIFLVNPAGDIEVRYTIP
jgi:LysM repeat protein